MRGLGSWRLSVAVVLPRGVQAPAGAGCVPTAQLLIRHCWGRWMAFLLSCWQLLPLVQARQKLHVLVALQLLAAAGQAQPRSKLDPLLCAAWLGWEKLQGVGKERCGLFEVMVTNMPTRSCSFPSVALGRGQCCHWGRMVPP